MNNIMNNIIYNKRLLWILLFLTIITLYYYINDLRTLLLFIFLITFLRLYTNNMIIILFISLFIVSSFNLLELLNISNYMDSKSIEYHILNKVNYINDKGTLLNELTSIKEEIPYKNKVEWLDIQQMIVHFNKLRPTID